MIKPSKWFLGILLLVFGLLKIFAGHSSQYLVKEDLFYLISIAEILLGVLVFSRYSALAVMAALSLFCGGLIVTIFFPHRPCGCFGPINISAQLHVIVTSILGVYACKVLLSDVKKASKRGPG